MTAASAPGPPSSNHNGPGIPGPPDNFDEFAAPGTKLFYEFTPLAKLPGRYGDQLRLSTIVGVVRTAERAEKVFAVRITMADVHGHIEGTCRLDYDELSGLISLIDSILRPDVLPRMNSLDPAVALITFETREGFVLEYDGGAGIRIGKSRTVVQDERGLKELEWMLTVCRSHLNEYREPSRQ